MDNNRESHFIIYTLLLVFIGFLQYLRKVSNGKLKMKKTGKLLYLSTLITFVFSGMLIMVYTEMSEALCFTIGLFIATLSEHIAKFFVFIGDNFNRILSLFIKRYFNVEIEIEINEETGETEEKNKNKNKNKKSWNKNS